VSAAVPWLIEGSAMRAMPEKPMMTAEMRLGLGSTRIQIAVTTATTIGRAPFIMLVMLEETVCSASG